MRACIKRDAPIGYFRNVDDRMPVRHPDAIAPWCGSEVGMAPDHRCVRLPGHGQARVQCGMNANQIT